MKTKRILSVALLAISTAVLLTACYKSNNTYNNGNPGNHTVSMNSSGFSPATLTVVAGSVVTWKNDDTMIRAVTTADASLNTGDIPPGSSFSITFNTLRTYNYYDAHNPNFTGVLVVTGSGGGGY